MNEKVDKFYELAYGDLTPEERLKNGRKNRMFILEHLDEIESHYDDCMKEGSGAQHEGLSESEIVKDAIVATKVNKYYKLAYRDLTLEERLKGRKNRMFILEHLDEIESHYDDCMKEGSGAQHEGLSESEIVKDAIVATKVNKYYKLAYGDLTPEERLKNGHKNRMFILEHLDEIELYYDDFMKEGRGAQHEGLSESEIVKDAIVETKVNKYYKLLYPNVTELHGEDEYNAAEDKDFIYKNIENIHRKFGDYVYLAERMGKDIDEQKIMQEVLKGVRRDYYYKLLYPNVTELHGEDEYNAAADKHYIYKNIENIHRKFGDYVSLTERMGEDIDEQKIIQEIIAELRTKQITPQQIGQVTQNASITIKRNADSVKNTGIGKEENTNDGKGEEVGDDN